MNTPISTRRHFGRAVVVGGIAANIAGLGCATKEADLGASNSTVLANAPPPSSSADGPWKLVDRVPGLIGIAVEDSHLVWFSGKSEGVIPETWGYTSALLHECEVNNCAASYRQSRFEPPRNGQVCAGTRPAMDGLYVYWLPCAEMLSSGAPKLNSRLIADLEQPGPDLPATGTYWPFRGGAFFWRDGSTILRCVPEQCTETTQSLGVTIPQGFSPIPLASSLVDDRGYIYLQDSGSIARTKADGAFPIEVLYQGHADEVGPALVRNGSVIWTEGFSNAARTLRICPTSGCLGEPTTVMSGIGASSEIVADDEYVYVSESMMYRSPGTSEGVTIYPEGDKITRVSLAGTEGPRVLVQGVGVLYQPILSGDWLFFIGSNAAAEIKAGLQQEWFDSYTKYIGAIPR